MPRQSSVSPPGRLLGRTAQLAHGTIPARMDALVMRALETEQRRRKNRRGDKRDQAPQQVAGSRGGPKEVTQEERKAALRATGATRQRNSGAEQLDKGARGHHREEIDIVMPKSEHQEIRDQVEKRELHHRDHDGEQHRREMPGGKLELLREGVDLTVDESAPFLDAVGRDPNAFKQVDDPMRHARDGLGHERHSEDAEQDAAVPAKAKDAEQRHVTVALGKKRHAGDEQNGTPCHKAELVDDEARELRRPGLAHVLARLGQTIDLSRCGAHHHRGQVTEEDAARLDRDQITDADGRVRVKPDGDRIGDDAEHQIEQHDQAGGDEPRSLDARHGSPELTHLPGHHQITDIGDQDDTDKDGAAACSLVVVAAGSLDLDLRCRHIMFRGIRHGSP